MGLRRSRRRPGARAVRLRHSGNDRRRRPRDFRRGEGVRGPVFVGSLSGSQPRAGADPWRPRRYLVPLDTDRPGRLALPGIVPLFRGSAGTPLRAGEAGELARTPIQLDEWRRRGDFAAAAVADELAVQFRGVLRADGPVAAVALRVEPRIPVARINFEDRLQLAVATIDTAFHERHDELRFV